MKRFASALIALFAVVALVTAAGSFGGADQPRLTSDTTATELPPEDRRGGSAPAPPNATQSADRVGDVGESPTPPADASDGGGVSTVFVVLLVGALLVAAVLAVVLTDDDTRAPPREDEGGGADSDPPTPSVDPAYDSPADSAVVRAWRSLTDRVDGVDDSTTPGEAAARATERGLPSDPVDGITDQFEAVRYGRDAPTAERERRAERLAARLDAERADERSGGDGA